MSGYTIKPPHTAFSAVRQRQKRQKVERHAAFIRALPCAVPGCANRDIHAAHLRAASPLHGKRHVGAGERPDDHWLTPLCGEHHLFGEESQHGMYELAFWRFHRIDPFVLALSLWRATGDEATGIQIIRETQGRAKP